VTMRLVWGREPAVWLALFAAAVQAISGFFYNLSDEQQGVLNALAVAFSGLLTALAVKGDYVLPAVLGFIQAALALGLAFGLHWDSAQQSTFMVLATAVVASFVRTQVAAPVAPAGTPAVRGASY
jgi:heme/copper-type cytochrome/quinol oxidase subunit 4